MKRRIPNLLTLATLMCALMFVSCQQDPGVLPQSSDDRGGPIGPLAGILVPIGGNAYITEQAAGGTETITSAGLTNWSNKNSIISTYFYIGKTGDLYVALNAAVPSGSSSVKVTLNGQAYTVNNITGTSFKKYPVGIISIKTPGYVKVDMQGVSNTNNGVFANVSDLLIYGSATTSNVYFANNPSTYSASRAGAAVNLSYNFPLGSVTEWFYNEISVPNNTESNGTNYISNGFNAGKAGLQTTISGEKRIVFTVNNSISEEPKLIRNGDNTTVDVSATNGKSVYLSFNWKTGVSYKFLTQAKPDGNGNTVFSSWVYTPEDDQWKLIASFSRTDAGNYLSGIYSGIQNVNSENGYMPRRMRCYNQWSNTSGTWSEVTSSRFNADATALNNQRLDYGASTEYSAFYLKSQGFFTDNLSLNTNLSRMATSNPPTVDFSSLP